MKIALIGLPNSGKTTIFNALTRSNAEVTSYASTGAQPNMAVVDVPDERVDRLTTIYHPRKTTYATLEVVDFAAVKSEGSSDRGIPDAVLREMRNADALSAVVRNFDDSMGNPSTPGADAAALAELLLLSDLIVVENRLERIASMIKKGQKTPLLQVEERLMQRLHEQLENEHPLRELELNAEERAAIKGFQFLTLKPMLLVVNSSEEHFGKDPALLDELGQKYPTVEFAGTFEMELARIDNPDEAAMFMEDMGISESARDRLARRAYEVLGYISFFTVGEDEVRAWNSTRGDTAVDAAGVIHTDLARGFIRAECFMYADLVELGSEKAVKDAGRMRLEGKNYIVKDGDILSIRFNV